MLETECFNNNKVHFLLCMKQTNTGVETQILTILNVPKTNTYDIIIPQN